MARKRNRGRKWAKIAASIAAAFIVVLGTLHLLASDGPTEYDFKHEEGRTRLVVLVHGLTGRERFEPAVELAREALPESDLLVFDYDVGYLSNASPYAIANVIEKTIHKVHSAHNYDEIVLVGHSIGGMLLRKSVVWGSGLEEDRQDFGLHGRREWMCRVTRFVSLATINRGWSIEPRPRNMDFFKYVAIGIGERLARLSQSGQLLMALQRGSPFVADARIQWINLFRKRPPAPSFETIHLLGDRDDIVSKEDSMDLVASPRTVFVTLPDTGHAEIGAALSGGTSESDRNRREKVGLALKGQIDQLDRDQTPPGKEDPAVKGIVYLMHGIRDYGEWTEPLRAAIDNDANAKEGGLKVINRKYGYFPMGPFLLYWDRQKNVRLFMDEYTENHARFPNAVTFDYAGHSNGTYILASALQHYKTLEVRRVYFAGSVVPQSYPWRPLADSGRVRHVVNVVAAGDWVVALFPRFFEQIADWRSAQPVQGPLDIGAAGFRGFRDTTEVAGNRIENIKFAQGSHGTGVDVAVKKKMDAIVTYIVSGDSRAIRCLPRQDKEDGWLDVLSNLCWNLWVGGLDVLSNLCWILWVGGVAALVGLGVLAFKANPWVGGGYVLLLLGLLNSL